MAALHEAMADALDARMAARVRVDKGARHLATTLAQAAGRGADPTRLLRAAAELDDLEDARSPALVLASRIEDLPSALGIPRDEPAKKPLPWLPAPSVGHPEWDRYLAERAGLIAARATELGSLAAAYREQYTLTHLPVGDLGDPPPDMTSQQQAYQAVLHQQALAAARAEPRGPDHHSSARPSSASPTERPTPVHVGQGLHLDQDQPNRSDDVTSRRCRWYPLPNFRVRHRPIQRHTAACLTPPPHVLPLPWRPTLALS